MDLPADAERRSIATGDLVDVRSNGTSVALRARIDRLAGVEIAEWPRSTPAICTSSSRWCARVTQLLVLSCGDAGEPWWIAVIEALVIVNLVLFVRLPDAGRAEGDGADAAPVWA